MGTHRAKPGSRARRLLPGEREKLIVGEAIRFFAEAGFSGQTRELSRRLGITQPLLYRYFPSKRALLERVYQEVFLGRWDPTWETLLQDRAIPLRDRLIEFYRRYTKVVFRPEWIRLYMYAGLAGTGFNRRYIDLLEKLLLVRICIELRHALGLPDGTRSPVTPFEMELAWDLHGGIFYYCVRKYVYGSRVHQDLDALIENAVDSLLLGAPEVLGRLLGKKRKTSKRGGEPMKYREQLRRIRVPRKAMLKRVARFEKLKGFDGGLPDSRYPGCERILYNVIGFQPPKGENRGAVTSPVGDKASRLAAIKISEGFNLGYCRALPGRGPMFHNHDTNETFIAMTGTWRASWENDKGRVEHVDLKPLDVISFPPGVSRRFMNVTRGSKRKYSILMFVIGGNAPRAEFTRESMAALAAGGYLGKR